MLKKIITFRILSWLIGLLLALISRIVFGNDNDMVWNVARHYNEIVSILSLIPIAQIMLVVNMIRTKDQIMSCILAMSILVICFFCLCRCMGRLYRWCLGFDEKARCQKGFRNLLTSVFDSLWQSKYVAC